MEEMRMHSDSALNCLKDLFKIAIDSNRITEDLI